MTGEPFERKPSTSSGELPPTHTVAPKFSRSRPDRVCEVLIPHDGSGTRSGSAARGGLARYGTRGSGASPKLRVGAAALGAAEAQQPRPFTTVSLTLAVASAAVICSRRTTCGAMAALTVYFPGASRTVGGGKPDEKPAGSVAQPRARP